MKNPYKNDRKSIVVFKHILPPNIWMKTIIANYEVCPLCRFTGLNYNMGNRMKTF